MERAVLLDELDHILAAGQEVKYEAISGEEARSIEPTLSAAVGAAVRIHGQRYLNPPAFTDTLAASVREPALTESSVAIPTGGSSRAPDLRKRGDSDVSLLLVGPQSQQSPNKLHGADPGPRDPR